MNKEQILKEVEKLLEEEKWSKFQLSEYNLTKFKKIDELVKQIIDNKLEKEITDLANDYIKKNEFSLIGKYLVSLFALPENKELFIDGFKKIITNFKDREKWGIVEYLSNKMLKSEENEFGLRSLIESLKVLNKNKDIPVLQERLIKLNPEDYTIAINIARFYENENNKEEAVKYYTRALKLFINKKNSRMVEDIWLKILENTHDPYPIYIDIENVLKSNFEPDFIVALLSLMIHNLIKSEKYDEVITLLKNILKLQPNNKEYREELIKVYRLRYKDHSKIEELLKSSGMRMWWKSITHAIELFEKQIKFDKEVYVFHHSWGTGKITTIDKDLITIDFEKNKEHKMSFDMALNTLQIIPEDHVKVKKRYNIEEVQKMANKDPIQLIELIVNKTENKEVTVDDLKDEMTDKIISNSDWQRWWAKVKKALKTHQNFKFLETEKLIKFIEGDDSYGDIILSKFQKASEFFDKIKIINELLENDINKKVNIEIYQEMADYLIDFIKNNLSLKPELAYISSIILDNIKTAQTKVSIKDKSYDYNYIINHVDNIVDLFRKVNIVEYQKKLIGHIKEIHKDWDNILYKILLTEVNKSFDYIIETLITNKKTELIEKAVNQAIEKYREYPELFYYSSKNIFTNSWDKIIPLNADLKTKIFQNLFFLLSFSGRQIKNKVNTEHYNKVQKQIIRLLFDKNTNYFLNFVKESFNNNQDITSLLNLFRENEYVPKKQRENIVAELRGFETSIVF